MFQFLKSSKRSTLFRILCLSINTFFLTSVIFPAQFVRAQMQISLPPVGSIVSTSPDFAPAHMVGIQVSPEYPLNFNFLISQGDKNLDLDDKTIEYEGLIRYFMTALTVPEQELWVNLSPYESNRIIPKNFSRTEMGRDLLSLDYILKQLTSSLMYPEDELGEKFWNKVKQKAFERYGVTDIPISTFNKVWILPDKAVVFEKNGTAMITESRLKVMLEEDLIALENEQELEKFGSPSVDEQQEINLNGVPSEVIRDLVIPEIEKEVNQGASFSKLRQIYSSMILASWFKRRLKQSILNKVYSNQGKVDGINLQNTEYKQDVYNQYLESYKQGAYNYVREEYDPIRQEIIPKKYFSGGFDGIVILDILEITNKADKDTQEKMLFFARSGNVDQVLVEMGPLTGSEDVRWIEYIDKVEEYFSFPEVPDSVKLRDEIEAAFKSRLIFEVLNEYDMGIPELYEYFLAEVDPEESNVSAAGKVFGEVVAYANQAMKTDGSQADGQDDLAGFKEIFSGFRDQLNQSTLFPIRYYASSEKYSRADVERQRVEARLEKIKEIKYEKRFKKYLLVSLFSLTLMFAAGIKESIKIRNKNKSPSIASVENKELEEDQVKSSDLIGLTAKVVDLKRGNLTSEILSSSGQKYSFDDSDKAMATATDDSYGGISLEDKYLNLESRGEIFDIPLPEEYMWMEQIPISGFVPQILEIIPAGATIGPLPFFNVLEL